MMQPSPYITLHGVIRYIERVAGLPLQKEREKNPALVKDDKMAEWLRGQGIDLIALSHAVVDADMEAALKSGCTAYKRDGFTYVANARGAIVTILEPGQRQKDTARYRAHINRSAEARP